MTTKELLEKYDTITREFGGDIERALWNILKANEKHIEGLIEADTTGHWFHKAHRQIDVTGDGRIDIAIWLLLQQAPLFWKMIEQNNKIVED